ncbi:hypothetical protein MNV_1150002 [Candidatus Methanoperedens nitroreducens]|uniref:Uncharacterized protein n=1 Tax=Candidatus Methanoperedens nitratireducens TaxID=1392998 RepID=A0A284VJD7_9EURY|nr:hypothetical protein MNV_1150002 [Candidatus Methanoperedens nitroreducens]
MMLKLLDIISVVQLFPHRTDAHIRVTEWNFIAAWLVIRAFNEMNLIFNA